MKSCPIATQGRDVQKRTAIRTTRKRETPLRERGNPQTQRRGEQPRLGTQVGARGCQAPGPEDPGSHTQVAKMPAVGAARSRTEARKLKKPRSETLVTAVGTASSRTEARKLKKPRSETIVTAVGAASTRTEARKLKKPRSETIVTAVGAASTRETTKAETQASTSTRATTWKPPKRLGEARCQQ